MWAACASCYSGVVISSAAGVEITCFRHFLEPFCPSHPFVQDARCSSRPPEYIFPIRGALFPSPFVLRFLLSKMRGVFQGPRTPLSNPRGVLGGVLSPEYFSPIRGALSAHTGIHCYSNVWVPASAGTTRQGCFPPSFPRMRESSPFGKKRSEGVTELEPP